MKIKQVTVGVQRIINLGNYENVRYECTATAEVEEGDNPEQVYADCLHFCKDNVLAEVERLEAAKGAKRKK